VESFRRALELSPDNATYHYHLGLAELKAGHVQRGRASLARAIDLKPDATLSADVRRALSETTNR
jgi:Flp pilus assembly protein TadD